MPCPPALESMRSCGLSLSYPRGAAICRRRDRRAAVPLFEMTREDLVDASRSPSPIWRSRNGRACGMSCAITSKYLVTRILLGLARRPGVAGGAVTAAPAGRAARWVAAGAALTTLAALRIPHHDKPACAGPRREACTCVAPADAYCLCGDWPSDPCDLIYGPRGRSSQRCRSSACPAARNSRPRVPTAVVLPL